MKTKNIVYFTAVVLALSSAFFSILNIGAKEDSHKLWGMYEGAGTLEEIEKISGRKADIEAVFMGWRDDFPSPEAKPSYLLVFWEQYGVSLDSIISGQEDDNIKRIAAEAKAYQGQVILAPLHEMNGDWDPWSGTAPGNSPQKIILAFRRINLLFGQTENIKFAWVVNHESVPDTKQNSIENYYPGDDVVDFVGVDGFNFANPWQSWGDIFYPALDKLRAYKKPILITSMACAKDSRKAAWISDALQRIKNDPDIAGFVWFNEDKEQSWSVSSSRQSLASFIAAVRNY